MRLTLLGILIAIAGVALALPGSAGAAQLVQNGGFETGDLTDWTTNSGADLPWIVMPGGSYPNTTGPHSGTYYANTGCVGSACIPAGSGQNYLTQNLPTVAGQTYSLSFWYDPYIGGTTELAVNWSGSQVFDLTSNDAFDPGYTQYTVSGLVAPGSSTALTFLGRQDPSYLGLDDISVTGAISAVPEPSSLVLMFSGLPALGGLVIVRRRKVVGPKA